MEQNLYEALQIQYIKLHFTIEFQDDYHLPEYKESAIRGGLGEMLLRANCIKDRKCDSCEYSEECVVRRTMYSSYKIKPDFVTTGDSIGYVIYCKDHRKRVKQGDKLQFQLMLFGNSLVYFNLYVQAFYALGMNGIGKDNARFIISKIQNNKREDILINQQMYMKYYRPETIYDYVMKRYSYVDSREAIIKFITPLTLKYQNEFLDKFDMNAVVRAIKRRIYMMNCYVGQDVLEWYKKEEDAVLIMDQTVCHSSVKRYSSTQNTKMRLKGIVGEIDLDEIAEEVLYILLAGELIHVGKNTSFGFGKYIVRSLRVKL